jgi:hypothetical protein
VSDFVYKSKLVFFPTQKAPVDPCGCHYCNTEWRNYMDDLDPDGWTSRITGFMILCPDCGCKRCPRATYHGHACTESNDPGQPWSIYGGFKLPNEREEELDDEWKDLLGI